MSQMLRTLVPAGLMLVTLLGNAGAAAGQIALGVKAGTTGVGGDISVRVAPRIALRAGATVMPIKPEGTFSDVSYQVDIPGPLFTANADIYLLGGLRVMGGMLVGADETTITGIFQGTVDIGGQSYSGAELGALLGEITSNNVAPFAGIGLGKTVGRLGVSLDIAAAFLGDPTLALRANSGTCSQNAQCNALLQANLVRESAEILDDFGMYARLYPMLTLGLHFRFGAR
jgi:hypothetical protein